MKEKLIELLSTLGYPVYLQGAVAPDAYPESFFTFWTAEAPEAAFYDNSSNRCVWGFWVYFYSNNPLTVMQKSEVAWKLLKQNGYCVNGKPIDLSCDVPSYTGAMFEAFIAEEYSDDEGH